MKRFIVKLMFRPLLIYVSLPQLSAENLNGTYGLTANLLPANVAMP